MKPFSFVPELQKGTASAAVALLWSQRNHEILFIERSQRDDDPWSGQMGFPGGRLEADESPLQAAIRETREEVGVEIPSETHHGFLESIQGRKQGKLLPFFVHAAVFQVEDSVSEFQLCEAEVQRAIWLPIDFFADPNNLKQKKFGSWELPCYPIPGNYIWGMSFMFLRDFLLQLESHALLDLPELHHLR